MEHIRSRRPSTLLTLYLFLSLVFDGVQARTLWHIHYDAVTARAFVVATVIKAGVLLLESKEKRLFTDVDYKDLSPEDTNSFFNRAFIYWVNGLIRKGYRKILMLGDLYPLDEELTAESLYKKFWIAWEVAKFRQEKHRMLLTLFRSLKFPFLIAISPRLCLIGLTFCQPLFLKSLLRYLQEPSYSRDDGGAMVYVFVYALIYLGKAVSTGFYWRSVHRFLTMVRSCLSSAIYAKSLETKITALDSSVAVTLMSTDMQKIEDGLEILHELWANTLEVGIATWLLEREMGAACVVAVIVAIASMTGAMWLGSKAGALQVAWAEKTQNRIGVVATMLPSMKGVKMLGLTQKLSELIQALRVMEVRSGNRFRILELGTAAFAFTPTLASPVITFAIFILIANRSGQVLDTTRIFTSISLLILVSSPLEMLFQLIPNLMAAVACLHRIEDFLVAEPRVDRRHIRSTLTGSIALYDNTSAEELQGPNLSYGNSDSHVMDNDAAIVVRNGTFGWARGQDILHSIDLIVPRSKLTLIIGPVACGKSTLCKAFLGETLASGGVIDVHEHSEIAFCDQTSFLTNNSLQRNILGVDKFDGVWYSTVIEALALREDIKALPQGDQTLIGTNGITLSGGQKQRVAIARAVYARKRIAIFDDVFSGLDILTAQHVFNHVFKPQGLLSRLETTVILSTHAVEFLAFADKIIVLGTEGKVVQDGTFEDLNATSGYVESLFIQKASRGVESYQPTGAEVDSNINPKQDPLTTDTAIDKGGQVRGTTLYNFYLQTVGLRNASIWLVLGIANGFFWVVPTLWLKQWSDANVRQHNQSNVMYLLVYTGLNILALVALLLFHGWGSTRIAFQAGTRMHRMLLDTVMSAPMAYFARTDIGITINKFSQDMELIDGELPLNLNNLSASVFIALAQLALMTIASPYLAMVYPVLILLFYLIQSFYLRTSRQLRLLDLEAKSPLYSHFLETLNGLATIRAFGWSEENRKLNNKLLNASQQPAYLLVMIQRWLNLVADLLTTALGVILVFLVVKFRANSGSVGVALINLMDLNAMLRMMIMSWTTVETSIGSVSRVKTFYETSDSENDPREVALVPDNWPHAGNIEIHKISASYGSPSSAPVLRNLTMSISPGSRIGICGRTGAGKSSLILALFRMLPLHEGIITIDGIDISTVPKNDLRARLNAIPQDPYFLKSTVRLNLDPYERASDAALIEALKKVKLWDTIDTHGGLAAELDAATLSHGQRQLFCLARAMLRPGRIVVLDEATSSVDRQTDATMQRLVREEFRDRTVITVAHRLETVLDCDRVAVLRDGALVEFEPPDVLLGRQSAFRDMWEGEKLHGGDAGEGEQVGGD